MMDSLFIAIGLVFLLEGFMPFLSPRFWRRAMQQVFIQNDKVIRMFGFISMLIGLVILYIVRN